MSYLWLAQDRRLPLNALQIDELKRALDEGSVVLGGCEIGHSVPFWVCMGCRTDFRKLNQKPT